MRIILDYSRVREREGAEQNANNEKRRNEANNRIS